MTFTFGLQRIRPNLRKLVLFPSFPQILLEAEILSDSTSSKSGAGTTAKFGLSAVRSQKFQTLAPGNCMIGL